MKKKKLCSCCGLNRKLNKDGYCEECQDVDNAVHEVRKARRIIPFGMYCYKEIKKTKNGYKRIGICPYWSIRKEKSEQENGYCAYLKKGDWDLNKEVKWQTVYKNGRRSKLQSADELGLCMSLIWDMVKECDINEEIE